MNVEMMSLQQALSVCQCHRQALQEALDDLNNKNIDLLHLDSLSKSDRRLRDQFAYRYTRLQDDMGTKGRGDPVFCDDGLLRFARNDLQFGPSKLVARKDSQSVNQFP